MRKQLTDEAINELAEYLLSRFMKENPDAESVRDEMANLLENGSANTLHDAFFKAMIGKALDGKIKVARSRLRGESSAL